MSEATFEAVESEAFEAAGEAGYEGEAGEATYEGEGEATGEASYEGYGEDARSDARRRARQRQILLARQRQAQAQAQARRPAPAPAPRRPAVTGPSQRQVMTAIRSLDLDTKMELDSLRRALKQADRLAYQNAWAAEASVAASQVLDSFTTGLGPHDWARALIRGAPTLLLAPGQRRRPGIEGILLDPRVGGGALLAAIWGVGQFMSRSKGVSDIVIDPIPPAKLAAGSDGTLSGYYVDKHGNEITDPSISAIRWDSQDQTVLQVSSDGSFNSLKPGVTLVIATGGGLTRRQQVTVTVP